MEPTLKKVKSRAFRKDVYLLGKHKDGDYIWLEAATWDCEWFWGFGYIEVYTRQRDPANSNDISSHSHWSGLLGEGTGEGGDYTHHINQVMAETVLTEGESWELSDLIKSTYTLKEAAAFFHQGGSNLSQTKIIEDCKNDELAKQINEVELVKLFNRIYEILTPEINDG